MRNVDAVVPRLAALKATGVRIAIDDFGTGYSSLAYLQQFPVDTLKIDRSFISTMADSPESGALIRTLVQLGKTLGLRDPGRGDRGVRAVLPARARPLRQRAGVPLRPAARSGCRGDVPGRVRFAPRAPPPSATGGLVIGPWRQGSVVRGAYGLGSRSTVPSTAPSRRYQSRHGVVCRCQTSGPEAYLGPVCRRFAADSSSTS